MAPSLAQPALSSHIIPGVRGSQKNYQHDRTLISHTAHGTVLAVFDGHGLNQSGHIISALCAERFMPLLEAHSVWKERPSGRKDNELIKALAEVVRKLEEEADALTEKARVFSGSTLCAVIFRGGWMYTVNVGDSRAVLGVTRGNGIEAVQLTKEHSVNDPVERERIEQNGGWVANNRLNGDLEMSRTIGDTEFKRYRNQRRFNRTGRAYGPELLIATPDIEARRVAPGDVLVIVATDGVWVPGLENETVVLGVAEFARTRGVHAAAEHVVKVGLEWGSTDNISAVVGVFREIPEIIRKSRFRAFREKRRLRKQGVDKDRTVYGEHQFDGLGEEDDGESL